MTESPQVRRGGSPVPGPLNARSRILVAGDTHGNERFIEYLARRAELHGCAGIVQLGDFGFWPDQRYLRSHRRLIINDGWLTQIARLLARRGLWMRVIDGNHDFVPGVRASYRGRDGIVALRDGVLDWATRGARWTWCGRRFGALGGAVSIDSDSRVPGLSWWPEEALDEFDIERLGGRPLDVLLTHDAPLGAIERAMRDLSPHVASRHNRLLVELARRHTSPRLLLHGHFHHRYSTVLEEPPTRVEGLDADIAARSGHPERAWGLLDLPSLSFRGGEEIEHDRLISSSDDDRSC